VETGLKAGAVGCAAQALDYRRRRTRRTTEIILRRVTI